ncbi:MAG: AmmeMemoRadiSam system protein B [Syntrophorhabdaceae bacterium]|nr:AmmeMemoRadiSam system protein B [Syntrophorhabdaceae bacterium]
MEYLREPAVSGVFYPDNPSTLKKEIKGYLEEAEIEAVEGEILGVISPHAGYIYSGPVAAYGFKSIMGRSYDTVIVLAPSHRSYFEGVAVIDRGGYKTPFGVVPIDEIMAEGVLRETRKVFSDPKAHRWEHSLEVQLPFLQTVLEGFKLLPLIMGSQDVSLCESLADSIYNVVTTTKKKVLIVGSSDLSHYHPYNNATRIDSIAVRDIEAFDIERFKSDFAKDRFEACGFGPMLVTMLLCKRLGAHSSKVLKYANSGDTSGDKDGVVGYLSAIFFKKREDQDRTKTSQYLSEEEKAELKAIAREAIESILFGTSMKGITPSERLKAKAGAFVTIKIKGELKGCIGYIHEPMPLYETVKNAAIHAAFQDPRFTPLTKDEWKDAEIEISVLTPMKRIKDIDEIEVGKHGLYIEKGYHSGLLLPQVATEYGWDVITFLEHTCYKAGLDKDAWRSKDTKVYIFSAQVF